MIPYKGSQIQELQDRMNCFNGSVEFQEVDSNYSGFFHFLGQPACHGLICATSLALCRKISIWVSKMFLSTADTADKAS